MSHDTQEFQHTFEAGQPARLALENIRGTVDIQAGPDGVISVTALRHNNSGDVGRTQVEVTQGTDGRVKAITRYEKAWISRPCRVDYTVRLPRECEVEVSVVTCPTSVQGLHGRLRLRTVSGDLLLHGLSGALRVQTVSGQVTARGLRLDEALDLDTVSGHVRLAEASLPAVKASTVSGDLDLDTPLGAGPYQFNSVSGDVRLLAQPDAQCAIHMSSLSGRLRTTRPLSYHSAKLGRIHAIVGADSDAAAQLRLSSVSGSLYLLGPNGGADETATAAPGAPGAPDRREILDRIASGELSVEEAIGQL